MYATKHGRDFWITVRAIHEYRKNIKTPGMTTKEAARRLGVTPQMVNKLILRGRLVAVKMGRDYYINELDLAMYIATRRPPGRPMKRN